MSTFASRRMREIRDRCDQLADEASSEDGYVVMRQLVELFDAEIIFRPLLVEAMIAKKSDLSKGGSLWKILLNEEVFGEDAKIYNCETSEHRLSPRGRNTIAHELIHTFQFRVKDNQIIADRVTDNKSRADAILRFLEREAHSLTSLLLIPQWRLNDLICELIPQPSANSYIEIYQKFGTSREIFIQALNHLRSNDEFKIFKNPNVVDVWIGVGHWDQNLGPQFKLWPRFSNFANKSIPDFILKSLDDGQSSFVIPNLSIDFVAYGGGLSSVDVVAFEGSKVVPEERKVIYRISAETRQRTSNGRFLFVIRRISEVKGLN
jgi:hypothetical protein